jgi:hypothetical protein
MQPRRVCVLILGTLILAATAYLGKVQATPSAGFTAATLAVGRFGEINASSHVFFPDDSQGRHMRNLWLSFQKTKGPSDLYVQSNVWVPGGTTGIPRARRTSTRQGWASSMRAETIRT